MRRILHDQEGLGVVRWGSKAEVRRRMGKGNHHQLIATDINNLRRTYNVTSPPCTTIMLSSSI